MGWRRQRTPRRQGHRIFFATDVHGSEACFRKFLNAREAYRVDDLVLGGDMTGKLLVPVVRGQHGDFTLQYGDNVYEGIDAAELERVVRMIRDHGHYPYVGANDEIAALDDEPTRDAVFRRCVYDVVTAWAELAETRLRGTGCRCFMAPGNDDFLEIDSALEGGDAVIFAENKCLQLTEAHEMITTGYSNLTPWDTERELDEAALAARIDGMASQVNDPSNLVAVLHAPPFNSSIDQAPELDAMLNVSLKVGGGVVMAPVGSAAVRSFIEDVQPLLGLHGHVHEGLGSEVIGRTLCLNPGSEYANATLAGAIVELGFGEVLSYQFVTG
jgi:uncharacterized protein